MSLALGISVGKNERGPRRSPHQTQYMTKGGMTLDGASSLWQILLEISGLRGVN